MLRDLEAPSLPKALDLHKTKEHHSPPPRVDRCRLSTSSTNGGLEPTL
jgi:hypothetical protein